jgi:pimeloyl-ACP methyl ester carboxylesterase
MPHAELNGQGIYYEVHGEGEPLLCIHGLGVDLRGWIPQVPDWSERYRVVIFSNRDVGRSSPAPAAYETADMAADALALADHLDLDSFHLVGLSLGGAVAQHVALAAPERVKTLTLAVTYGGGGAYGVLRGGSLGAIVRGLSREERVDFQMLLAYTEEFFADAGRAEFIRNAMIGYEHFQDAEAFARQAAASGRHDVRDRLHELAMPVHVIGAERDVQVPVWKSEELAALIPGAKLTVIAGAGHGVSWERPDEFNRAVTDFLATAAPEAVR